MYFLLKVFGGFPQQKVRPDGNKNPVDAREKKRCMKTMQVMSR